MATNGRTVTLQSRDLMQFVVDREVAKNSGVVKNLLEDFTEENPTIPFMNVQGKILEKVIEFMTYHHRHSFLLGDDKEKDPSAIEPWDKNFCNVDQATLSAPPPASPPASSSSRRQTTWTSSRSSTSRARPSRT